ncbi:MAG: imidazolonepropionase [Acidimicrobiales bacterium]
MNRQASSENRAAPTGTLVVRNIGRLFTSTPAGVVTDATLAVKDGRIAFFGPEGELPGELAADSGELDAGGALVTPGLIDAHSHPVYGGDRFEEIALRSTGASYGEIAASGGGIAASVRDTRAASEDELEKGLRTRLSAMASSGTTTVEAKSGYQLEEAGELSTLRMLARISGEPGLPLVEATFLGAHAVAPESASDPDGYVESVASWCAQALAAGARHVDVFCDEGYFTIEQSRRILKAGASAGLIGRIHADELARTGGAMLAAELSCASADHLLRITAADAQALARGGVTATLCPVTALAMGLVPPLGELRRAGVSIALGSDHNPGTCGTTSMPFVIALGVSELGLSVADALRAATAGGALSLRLSDRGIIAAGLRADLVIWDADHEGAFAWSYGLTPKLVLLGGLPMS